MWMEVLLECGGALLVLYGLHQVFRDIFHPTASGSLSDLVGRLVSVLLRHTRFRPAVGPIALVSVILCWVALLTSGFAFIYCGLLPNDLATPHTSTGASLAEKFLASFYFSLGSFDTFQTFDLIPRTNWLKLVVSVEGLVGISMITASVSWLVLLYPALMRTRQLARRISSLLEAEKRSGLSPAHEIGAPLLMDLAQAVLQFRLDIVLFPMLLNFYPTEGASVAFVLPEIHRLSIEALALQEAAGTRLAGTQLQVALESLSHVLATRVLRSKSDDLQQTLIAFQQREQ